MGVPVLTLSGRSFASRVCGSLVRSAGLTDLVCTSAEDYVARAIALAGNRGEIEAYKTRLRDTRDTCRLFDTGMLVGRLENLYRQLCDAQDKGLTPQPDLANLDSYFEAGVDHDHDGQEVLKIADYHGLYRAKLKRFHLARPLHADSRLWRAEDIAAAEGRAPQQPFAQLDSEDRILDRLHVLLALKARGLPEENLLENIRALMDPALHCFNRLVAAGDVEQAARYADALADLLPGNAAVLNAALSCNVALERKDRAAQLSASLAGANPAPPAPGAPVVQSPLHPLLQLRDLYDQASSILCGPLTEPGLKQVSQLRAAARNLDVAVPENSEWAGWEKHYRLAFQAIDVSAVARPTPEAANEDKIVFVTATGRKLDWRGMQAAAKNLRAQAAFFAAADKAYVDLYGRAYIESILEYSDVSSLVVLHVIGGAKDLPAIARSLGVSSNRLILAGDALDASRITTKCYDAPPKGLSALPVAHLQSVRFLRVGALLQKLKLPVFVSDIDLILQRGVSDLMEKFADCDIVLNENMHSANAGSRFTANLLLLNPTKHAAIFLRFLRVYLEKALSRREVTRWIDQFALLQARHHLSRRQPDARIGYFDVGSDINNLMYKSYQEHPFRFLSLYHGFDMSSLPGAAKARAGKPSRIVKGAARASAGR
jgi:hypothetical protein